MAHAQLAVSPVAVVPVVQETESGEFGETTLDTVDDTRSGGGDDGGGGGGGCGGGGGPCPPPPPGPAFEAEPGVIASGGGGGGGGPYPPPPPGPAFEAEPGVIATPTLREASNQSSFVGSSFLRAAELFRRTPQRPEADGGRGGERRIRSKSEVLSPGWCVGNSAYSLFLLSVALIIELVLFAFHCTPLMDVMVDEQNAAAWCGVTSRVAIWTAVFLVPSMLLTLGGIIALSCCQRRTIQRARKANEVRDVLKSESFVMTLFNYVFYAFSPANCYFFLVIFFSEAKETVVQGLALDQLSRAGVGPTALTLFTSLMLVNGLASSLGISWMVRHINRVPSDEDDVRRRVEASRWIPRLLLFDATCDLLYTFFGLLHLLFRYWRIFGETGVATDTSASTEHAGTTWTDLQIVKKYANATTVSVNDVSLRQPDALSLCRLWLIHLPTPPFLSFPFVFLLLLAPSAKSVHAFVGS